ncbi:MAG: sugar transferase [bacterium]|nr:sugar transferase [bacterium]
MLRENWISISRVTRFADNIIVVLAFFIAYYGRSSLMFWNQTFDLNLPFAGEILAPISSYYVILILALPIYNLSWTMLGAYDRARIFSSFKLLQVFLSSSVLIFFFIAAGLFLLKLDLSRAVIILFCSIVALSLTAERYLLRALLRYWNWRGRNLRNLVIVGLGEQAKKIQEEIKKRPELGINLIGFAIFKDAPITIEQNFKIFRGTADLEEALKNFAIDEVIFTDVRSHLDDVENMIVACADQGVRTSLAADLFSVGMAKSEVSYFGGMPLIHYHTPPGDRWELAIKRVIDFIIASLLLVVILPILILITLGIRIMSPGPVIFKQKRVGLNGRIFSMYKFRSMIVGAENELQDLIDKNEMDGPVFKLSNDPRITSFGRLLRRFSLDELPQLFNVFRGDMSLVGPRPPVPSEVSQYQRRYRRRLSMRPGITCIWQVTGRNEIKDFETWMKLDLEYIDNWSLLMDLRILFKTIPAVIFGYGAR